ncbi:uncharacterized protein LOC143020011 [Oratosquilla oratoria]|uniref:uncharacterized protein LOC143020011 n=1 Tax=Oratosquilla oratoria TaxID=337810 RepID=UPI003F7758D0
MVSPAVKEWLRKRRDNVGSWRLFVNTSKFKDTSQQSIDWGQHITLSAAYVRGQSCNPMCNMCQEQQESLMNLQLSVGLGPEMFEEGVEGSEGEDEEDKDDDGDSDEEMTGP